MQEFRLGFSVTVQLIAEALEDFAVILDSSNGL